jgi:hypothetical protein
VPELPHAAELNMSVILHGDATGEFRVALVKPCAVTHALDTSQRYIKLAVEGFTPNPPPQTTAITAIVPSDASVAPPGHYMVTVVGSTGSPSKAAWIKVLP